MSFTPADLPDLTGITAVVTGANSGIGFHTAQELSRHGATVVLACRDTASADKAATKLPGTGSPSSVRVEALDLASQASVKAFADRWEGPLDLLINNAGVMRPPAYRETEDGHELQFGTNHLGHYALTGRLLPALLAADSPRVVTVASIAHHDGNPKVVQGNPAQYYDANRDYAQSKLANVLFMKELHRRAAAVGSKLVSTGAHPGVSATGLVSDPNGMGANPVVRAVTPFLLPIIFQSAAAGANPTLYAATLGAPGSYTGPQRLGESRGPIGPAKLNKHAENAELATELWKVSEERTGVSYDLSAG